MLAHMFTIYFAVVIVIVVVIIIMKGITENGKNRRNDKSKTTFWGRIICHSTQHS